MTSEDKNEDSLMSVQSYIKNKSVTVNPLFSFLLQKMLKSVFLPPYDSLKLNHDKNYLLTSEDMVEDSLMSVHFFIKSNGFSLRVTVHLLFSIYYKRRLNLYFYRAMNL